MARAAKKATNSRCETLQDEEVSLRLSEYCPGPLHSDSQIIMNDQALWSTIEQDGNLLIDLLERTFDIPSRSIEEEPPLVAELEIPMHGLTIEGQLLSLGLDEATAKAVDQNYIRSLHRIATDLQRNYSKTCHTLKHDQGSPAESDLASLALRRVHQESFKRCADDLWLDIAAAVRDQRLPQDGTEDQPFTDEARERLERIFQRRDKLNTAEKKEIALQCNLSPRQVSIWVSLSTYSLSFPPLPLPRRLSYPRREMRVGCPACARAGWLLLPARGPTALGDEMRTPPSS